MKIMFMGTPEIAAGCLKRLIDDGKDVCAVVTREDKPRGRGNVMTPTAVKTLAIENGIAVYTPKTLRDEEFASLLSEIKPDLIVVVAYGKILPKNVIDFPKYGCINLHVSLLPKYRGSAPIQHSVLNGDAVTGVSTMLMDEGMDTGAILLTEEVKIEESDTSESMFDKLSVVGADLLLDTVNRIEEITPMPQDEALATYAPPIRKENAKIDGNKTVSEILNLIRGSFSWPIAFTDSSIGRIKVYSAQKGDASGDAGKVLG